MIAARQGVLGVMVPEAETAAQLGDVAARLADAMEILALVESAVGIWNALELARLPRVTRLAFGSLDLKRDTGIEDDGDGLLYSRSRVVVASRCAGIPRPGCPCAPDPGRWASCWRCPRRRGRVPCPS